MKSPKRKFLAKLTYTDGQFVLKKGSTVSQNVSNEYYDLFTYGEANIDFMKDDLNELQHAAKNPYNIKTYQGGAVSPK